VTRQILTAHLADGELRPGEPIGLRVDQTLLQDATGTMAFMQYEQLGVDAIQVDRAVQYVDHNVVALDHKNPDDHRFLRALAAKHGAHFSRPGNGISHYIHLERFGRPGDVLIGADSHTTTGGALGMLSIGAGGLDVAVVMGGHAFEVACPEVVEVRLEGELARPWVQAKDVILELLRRLSVRGGKGRVFEFTGPGVDTLSVPERGTIANMIAELGATSALFPPDERTREWLRLQCREEDFRELAPEDGCEYDERVDIDLGELGPLVARPPSPDDVVGVEALAGTEIAQVCLGSSVNSAYIDLALPGALLADRGGQVVHPSIDATATPGSRQIQAAIIESGVYAQLVAGGVRMLEPVCGPCVGMGQAPPSDANSLRTFNRNFRGRSGTASDCVYLCSPAVAAVSLLTGRIEDPREYGDPPQLLEAPELQPYVDDVHIFAPPPPEERERIEIPRGPNIKPPPEHTPLPDTLEGRIATVQDDDVSTGDLAPDGVEVMAYRSNVPAIAEFTLRARDPEFRRRIQEWGGGFIVGGENYGQGSSREHAALAPLQLGVRAVIAKSFARIHRRNLVAQGILALSFADPDDYARAEVGQTWELPRVHEELESGSDTISARIDGEHDLTLRHDFTPKERDVLLCGGLLAYLSGQDQGQATASGGSGEGTRPQREEREQGVGGRAE
jgi:aconitate hydratase